MRRPLEEHERFAIEQRRHELAVALAPFQPGEESHKVATALSAMFGSYRSMRQMGDDAMGAIESAMSLLADFPPWVIQKACLSIQQNGVWRGKVLDRQWPPSDSEIFDECKKQVSMLAQQHRSATALLAAAVEDPR